MQIKVQQDDTRPHGIAAADALHEKSNIDGWDTSLIYQPSNSLNFNVLDMWVFFFNPIQSLQHQTASKSVDDLVTVVKSIYTNLERDKRNYVFLSFQKATERGMLDARSNKDKHARISRQK